MKTHRHHRLARVALAACALLAATAASAAAQRTFVSRTGIDSNPCSITLPCRAFAAAIAQTLPGGEVVVLDSAGYGAVTIIQSVSIVAPRGIYAGVSVQAGDGITINAGATDIVKLRGLTITGLGGVNGIVATSVGLLDVADVEVSGFTNRGLDFAAPGGQLAVVDSAFVRNGEDGLHAQVGAGKATVTIDRSRFERNGADGVNLAANVDGRIATTEAAFNGGAGFVVEGGALATLSDCRATAVHGAAGTFGILVAGTGTRAVVTRCVMSGAYNGMRAADFAQADVSDSAATGWHVGFQVTTSAQLTLERSSASNTNYGVSASGFGVARVSNCAVTMSAITGMLAYTDGTIETRGNNTLRGNVQNMGGPGTIVTFGPL
jgi:hypothetical protein